MKTSLKTFLQRNFKSILALAVIFFAILGCGKLQDMMGGESMKFCENYTSVTDDCQGESTKFTTGTLTVLTKLKEPIGVTEVDLNITDLASGEVYKTYPFTVISSMDYIYFDNVAFTEPGKYKVSLLKNGGTVVITGEIEIVDK
jgi:hypothetical protein